MENIDKKKILIICVSIVVLVLAAFGIKKICFDKKKVSDEMELAMRRKPKVQVCKVRIGDVVQDVKFVGNIRANNQVVLRSEIEGVVKTIHFEEGGNVYKGDLLISLDDSLAIAKRNEIVARLEHAKAEYMRGKSLEQGKYMSESEIFKRKTEMISLEAQAELANIELSKYKIYAPFDGKVGLRDISIGEYVQRGKELLNLVNDNPLEVDFRVPEKEISNITTGEEIVVLLDSTGTEYTGVVKAVSPMADKTSHAFMVRGSLDDHDGLYPGQFVDVKVITQENRSTILVPETAVIKSEDGEYVFRIVDNTAFKTDVITGPYQQDGEIEIVSGLAQGEEVVISGHQQIGDGRQVDVIGSTRDNGGVNSLVDSLKKKALSDRDVKQNRMDGDTAKRNAEKMVESAANDDSKASESKNDVTVSKDEVTESSSTSENNKTSENKVDVVASKNWVAEASSTSENNKTSENKGDVAASKDVVAEVSPASEDSKTSESKNDVTVSRDEVAEASSTSEDNKISENNGDVVVSKDVVAEVSPASDDNKASENKVDVVASKNWVAESSSTSEDNKISENKGDVAANKNGTQAIPEVAKASTHSVEEKK